MSFGASQPMLCPVVIQGPNGALVAMYHPPASGVAPRGGVLVVPPFAEEMNRCRSMVTMQARALAALGHGVLVLDPFGTGDSAGDFCDATWERWLDDLRCGAQWLQAQGLGCQTLWGVRLGALMATQLAGSLPEVRRLLLWQPVVAGKTYWTQFLRIRIAAEMSQADGVKSTEELRQWSARGDVVEVSGFEVGAALAQRLDTLSLPAGALAPGLQVDWFEVLADAEAVVPKANAKAVDALRGQGLTVNLATVTGPAFWQVHERAVAPELLASTTQVAGGWPAPPEAPVPKPLARADVAAEPECPVVFGCQGEELSGVLHRGDPASSVGIVIVVAGGPQYRAGAHRQFVMLARMFAGRGYPVLRFDLRGMGDSSGEYRGFEDSRSDIRAAVDELQRHAPGVKRLMLFGECESATGILFYAYQDPRVRKVALANPWVRTEEGRAEVILKHYYRDRLTSRKFWVDMFSGRLQLGRAIVSFAQTLKTFLAGRKSLRAGVDQSARNDLDGLPLVAKTAEGLRRFGGSTLLLMSGCDYIAREFDDVTKSSQAWADLLDNPRVHRVDIADADHTFSRVEWKTQAHDALVRWLALPDAA